MRHIATTLFVLIGLTNFVPLIGVLGATHLASLYGVSLAGEELLLMRHRAVLLGLVGVFIMIAAIRVRWRAIATVAGLSSMLSYVLLAMPLVTHGTALQRIFWIDVIASILLLAGYLISRWWSKT